MEYHKQQNDENAIEVCTLPCRHKNPKVERFKISVFYEENPCWIKGWHMMIEPQYKKDNQYICDDYSGHCFVLIPDKEKLESMKEQAISEAKQCAIAMIRKLALGVLI